jgi:carboxylesterase type B
MLTSILTVCFFVAFSFALVVDTQLGISFENARVESPLLKLPYGTWRGSVDERYDTVTFKNVRFAAPPVGELRWAKPAPPLVETEIQNGTIGSSCITTNPMMSPAGLLPMFISSEDCLFLDVTVSRKVLEEGRKDVPVVVWIYGGAYGMYLSFIRLINLS